MVSDEVTASGRTFRLFLRINDLVGLKTEHDNVENSSTGRRIAAFVPSWHNPRITALQQLRWELGVVCQRIGLKVDEFLLVSEIYRAQRFKTLVGDVTKHLPEVLDILAANKANDVLLFSPICWRCNRVFSGTRLVGDNVEVTHFTCGLCGAFKKMKITELPGLYTFKLETALIWKFLGASLDFHGQDHAEAYCVACKIYQYLWLEAPPAHGRINLTFKGGKKISKSKGNSPPVALMHELAFCQFVDWITQRRFSLPLELGDCGVEGFE